MDEPCHSACPAGDCGDCAFPPRLVRCFPAKTCVQAERCARRDPRLSVRENAIDGTVLRVGKFCPLFVDRRGAMLEAA